jgi:hypothetical protein
MKTCDFDFQHNCVVNIRIFHTYFRFPASVNGNIAREHVEMGAGGGKNHFSVSTATNRCLHVANNKRYRRRSTPRIPISYAVTLCVDDHLDVISYSGCPIVRHQCNCVTFDKIVYCRPIRAATHTHAHVHRYIIIMYDITSCRRLNMYCCCTAVRVVSFPYRLNVTRAMGLRGRGGVYPPREVYSEIINNLRSDLLNISLDGSFVNKSILLLIAPESWKIFFTRRRSLSIIPPLTLPTLFLQLSFPLLFVLVKPGYLII